MDQEQATCSRCETEKPVDEFHVQAKRGKEYRHKHCKECHREIVRDHYQRNAEAYRTKAHQRRTGYVVELQEMIWAYLSVHPCIDCGEADPIVLQFDHVRGSKVRDVTEMVRRGWAWLTVKSEIDKCEIRCANCHLRRTCHTNGSWRVSPRSADGKRVTS